MLIINFDWTHPTLLMNYEKYSGTKINGLVYYDNFLREVISSQNILDIDSGNFSMCDNYTADTSRHRIPLVTEQAFVDKYKNFLKQSENKFDLVLSISMMISSKSYNNFIIHRDFIINKNSSVMCGLRIFDSRDGKFYWLIDGHSVRKNMARLISKATGYKHIITDLHGTIYNNSSLFSKGTLADEIISIKAAPTGETQYQLPSFVDFKAKLQNCKPLIIPFYRDMSNDNFTDGGILVPIT